MAESITNNSVAESNTVKTWKCTFHKFSTISLAFLLLGAVVYIFVTRYNTSSVGDSSSNNDNSLCEDENSSSASMTSKLQTFDATDLLTPPSTSLPRSSTDDIVYSELGDVISLIVPETQEVKARIHRAKTLKHQGRNDTTLSDSLIDLLGFGSNCEFLDRENADIGRAEKEQKRPDFDTLLIVTSRPDHGDLRYLIRTTWGSLEQCRRYRVLLRFVMGSPRTDLDVQLLRNESEAFGDILIGNFTDRVTRASAFKSLLAIRWALSLPCPVGFFIYSDDYTFMMMEKLPELLSSFDDSSTFTSILGSRTILNLDLHHADFHNENPLLERDFYPPTCGTDIGCILPFGLARILYIKFIWTTGVPLNYFDNVLGMAAEEYQWTVRHTDVFSRNILHSLAQACELKNKCTAKIINIYLIQPMWEKLSDPYSMDNCE